jgi:hypothetical protein
MQPVLGDPSAMPSTGRTSTPSLLRSALASTGLHVHRYRRSGDDPFSSASLYTCRCGVVVSAM